MKLVRAVFGRGILVALFLCLNASSAPLKEGFEHLLMSASRIDRKTGIPAVVKLEQDLPLLHTTQILPLDEKGELVGGGSLEKQAEAIFATFSKIQFSINSSAQTWIVKLNVSLSQESLIPAFEKILSKHLREFGTPVVSFAIGNLPHPGAMVAMDAVTLAEEKPSSIEVKQVSPSKFYPQDGVRLAAILPVGPKVYVSGMADTNALPEATRKTLEKLVACIGHLNLTKKDIVQLKAFLQPMSEVAAVRKEIVNFFDGDAPPVVFVEWISPPPNPPIEIELIAVGKGDFSKEPDTVTYLTPPGTTSTKVYNRVARVNHGKLIYISNLYGHSPDAAGQVREIFNSLGEILTETGGDFEHLVKATYYVADDDASNKLNDIRPKFYNPQRPPAASKAKVKSVGQEGKTVTMDMIAVVK